MRKNLKSLLSKLNVENSNELLSKSYGLSLSDQYWFKNEKDDLKWEDINFFTNSFDYDVYFEISMGKSSSSKNISLMSPNNTTVGNVQKAWIIEVNERYLLKGSFGKLNTEPINEWLASEIAKRMKFDAINYEVIIYKNTLASKCKCFINSNEELISAADIFDSEETKSNETDCGKFIRILSKHGIKDGDEKLRNMFLLDYLMGNYDRHLNNFGVIRDVNTLEWKSLAPIYDNGSSMCSNINDVKELDLDLVNGKFFTDTNKPLKDIYRLLNLKSYDLSPLKGIDIDYKNKLNEFKDNLFISDVIIDKLSSELKRRIEM